MNFGVRLSEQLKKDHESGDFGNTLNGYTEKAALLEDAILAMEGDGWLAHSEEGMSAAQKKCFAAYYSITK